MKNSLSMKQIIGLLKFIDEQKLFKLEKISNLEIKQDYFREEMFEIILRDMTDKNSDNWKGESRMLTRQDFPFLEDFEDYNLKS